MSSTANLQMPLLAQSQAQKHVTVNEALAVLDSVIQLTLESAITATPPSNPQEGQGYVVPTGATGDWAGQDGLLAVLSNGGWRFITPQEGWKAYVKDEAKGYAFDGNRWVSDRIVTTPNGAGIGMEIIEVSHTITSGSTNTTAIAIPAYTMVYGVSARVLNAVTGTLNGWKLGVADSVDRYGHGLNLASGSFAFGQTGQPLTYYSPTSLVLTAENGTFSSGRIRIALHLMHLGVPRS